MLAFEQFRTSCPKHSIVDVTTGVIHIKHSIGHQCVNNKPCDISCMYYYVYTLACKHSICTHGRQ